MKYLGDITGHQKLGQTISHYKILKKTIQVPLTIGINMAEHWE